MDDIVNLFVWVVGRVRADDIVNLFGLVRGNDIVNLFGLARASWGKTREHEDRENVE